MKKAVLLGAILSAGCGAGGSPVHVESSYVLDQNSVFRAESPSESIEIELASGQESREYYMIAYRFDPKDDSWQDYNFFNLHTGNSLMACEGEKNAEYKSRSKTENISNATNSAEMHEFYTFNTQLGGYTKVVGRKLVEGEYTRVWVDDANRDEYGLSDKKIQDIVEIYESYVHDVQEKIFGESIDLNLDGKVDFLFTNIPSPTIISYFNLNDFTDNPYSNRRDMIVVDFRLVPPMLLTTLAGTFQHLLTLSQRLKELGDAGILLPLEYLKEVMPKRWMATGLSLIAEDLAGMGRVSASCLSQYLGLMPLVNFRGTQTESAKGGAYLFLWKALSEKLQQGFTLEEAMKNIETSGISSDTSADGLGEVVGNMNEFFERFLVATATEGLKMIRSREYSFFTDISLAENGHIFIADEEIISPEALKPFIEDMPSLKDLPLSVGPKINIERDGFRFPGPYIFDFDEINYKVAVMRNAAQIMAVEVPPNQNKKVVLDVKEGTTVVYFRVENPVGQKE